MIHLSHLKVDSTGVVPMSDMAIEQMLGGHAVVAVGYDENKQQFICRIHGESHGGIMDTFSCHTIT